MPLDTLGSHNNYQYTHLKLIYAHSIYVLYLTDLYNIHINIFLIHVLMLNHRYLWPTWA